MRELATLAVFAEAVEVVLAGLGSVELGHGFLLEIIISVCKETLFLL